MPEFYFEPVARLQRYLGKELIADPNLAIMEFVKNSYDADSSNVLINFAIKNRPKEKQWINIVDDGIGMDIDSFAENWMHPGYSYKSKSFAALTPGIKSPQPSTARVPTGEKGLGRLAAGRLGDRMHIYTRTKETGPWLHVYIDWNQFETMDKLLNKIPITYDETANLKGSHYKKGTTIIIEGLTIDWGGKIGGKKVHGKSNYRIGRLREDLSILLQPIPQGQREFNIVLASDQEELAEYNGFISPMESSLLDYAFKVQIYQDKKGTYIKREVIRSPEIAKIVGTEEVTEKHGYLNKLYRAKEFENISDKLASGPFSGVIYYSPHSKEKRKELAIAPGVFIYRDGIRVEPYGQAGNDWLGAMAWKAARQGYAPVQPSHLTGYFMISRTRNPDLRDMSNRQGLIDNESYQTFLTICRNEFRWFGDLVLQEYVRPQWKTIEQKAQKTAERTQTFGIQIINSIAHSVRQSTAGLGAELGNMENLFDQFNVPNEMKNKFSDIKRRSWGHLEKIDETIKYFLKFDQATLLSTAESTEISLASVVEEAISQTKLLADSMKVQLKIDRVPPYKIRFNNAILVTALAALISNGIEAAHLAQRNDGIVKVYVTRPSNEYFEILIEDNGTGVQVSDINELISRTSSIKGRPSAGLILTRDAIAFAGGKVSLHSTNESGSTFKISLPAKGGF
jgi:signal transduction histidine kinase